MNFVLLLSSNYLKVWRFLIIVVSIFSSLMKVLCFFLLSLKKSKTVEFISLFCYFDYLIYKLGQAANYFLVGGLLAETGGNPRGMELPSFMKGLLSI